MERKKSNIGNFANLEIPMQKRAVKRICNEYGLDISELTIKIARDENLIKLAFAGSADYDNIGRIDLFPNAFIDKEQLVRTIIHEKAHVKQLKKYGKQFAETHIDIMEKTAERFEDLFYNLLSQRRRDK